MKLTPEKLTAFCAALAETCQVGKACKAVDISRQTAYQWRSEMPDFAAAWDSAMKVGVTALEDEAHRRAFEGVDKPLAHQGRFTYLFREVKDADGNPALDYHGLPKMEPVLDEHGNHKVAAVREYSDTLAIFLLKAHDPEKYRENSKVELSGHLALNEMSDDEIRAEIAALGVAGVLQGATHADDGSDLA
ncbi:terminase [Cupriavidus basilensis]|uniref:terminase small subunit-like protein n=1 Tax=Cupriavidus basilensis TaxID=68895 RepID=UPI000B33971B|nr:terminase [Cupriavidus basilensis]